MNCSVRFLIGIIFFFIGTVEYLQQSREKENYSDWKSFRTVSLLTTAEGSYYTLSIRKRLRSQTV